MAKRRKNINIFMLNVTDRLKVKKDGVTLLF